MKQILLWVPDDLHRRLSDRAREVGRSVNALATELLDLHVLTDKASRRRRLRARAAAIGVVAQIPAAAASTLVLRAESAELTCGWGGLADDLIDCGRDRL